MSLSKLLQTQKSQSISKPGAVGAAAGAAGGGYTGFISGGATGAAIGSIIPGVGTAIGGAIGGALGAIGGGIGGGAVGYKAGQLAEEGANYLTKEDKSGGALDAIQRRVASYKSAEPEAAQDNDPQVHVDKMHEALVSLASVTPDERKQYGPTIQAGYQKAVLNKYGVG